MNNNVRKIFKMINYTYFIHAYSINQIHYNKMNLEKYIVKYQHNSLPT